MAIVMSKSKLNYSIPRQEVAVLFLFAIFFPGLNAFAQGPVISLSPGGTIHTVAGNGHVTFSGDNGAATGAGLALPLALAADGSGNIFIADTNNHRVRRIDASGNITTVAGNGQQGFFGDGGPATSAALNQPAAVALDAAGNLYIADSGNHRIRKVSGGTISSFAGNGTAGFSGDSGAAANAALNSPRGVAVDVADNIYIADTENHRIRKVTGGIISTIAGNGDQNIAGDNGPAANASLDTPSAVAVDASGNVFIADSENQRIRKVAGGTITTLAGNGSAAYTGDGGPATSASLAYPRGVTVDGSGNVFIADSNNNVIRRVSAGGTITTVAANGEQGFFGDNGPPTAASMDTPVGVLLVNGNMYVADKDNHRIRRVDSTMLTFASQIVGTSGTVQTVTVSNSGSATLTLASLTPSSADFALAGTGTCGTSFPHNVAAGASCTLDINFVPGSVGILTGNLSIGDNAGGNPHTILVSGTGVRDEATLALSSAPTSPSFGDPVTITAGVTPAVVTTAPAPTGTVTFSEGSTILAAQIVTSNAASFTTTSLVAGNHTITVAYSGDTVYAGSSSTFTQIVNKATPTIAWSGPAAIVYGTALSVTQLNATSSVPGTFSYAPASGTVLNAGSQTLSVTFTPTDTTDYTTPISSVPLTVNQAPTFTAISSSLASAGVGANVTFTATVTSAGGTPVGSVSFAEGTTVLLTVALAGGTAAFTTASLTQGTHLIAVVYAGNTNFSGSAASTLTETIGPTDFTLTPGTTGVGGQSAVSVTVQSGQTALAPMTLTSTGNPGAQVRFSIAGLPSGATATFNPPILTLVNSASSFMLTVTTAGRFRYVAELRTPYTGAFSAGLIWLPLTGFGLAGIGFIGRSNRRRSRWSAFLALVCVICALGGCADQGNFRNFGTPAGSYQLVVTGTSGSTQRTTNITLQVQ